MLAFLAATALAAPATPPDTAEAPSAGEREETAADAEAPPTDPAEPDWEALGLGAEINVFADPFRRWDRTRWLLKTELLVPHPVEWRVGDELAMLTNSFQIRTVLACEKAWERGEYRAGVACEIEDVGLQAVALEPFDRDVVPVLQPLRDALDGAILRLVVTPDGGVADFSLERPGVTGVDPLDGTLRALVNRMLVGFDVRMKQGTTPKNGEWTEQNPKLMAMPTLASAKSSAVALHRVEEHDGQTTVISRGRGLVVDGRTRIELLLQAVSLYDTDEGFLTERVWSLVGKPNTVWIPGHATPGLDYFYVGRIRMLGEGEPVDVGPTQRIAPAREHLSGMADWRPIEE